MIDGQVVLNRAKKQEAHSQGMRLLSLFRAFEVRLHLFFGKLCEFCTTGNFSRMCISIAHN